jgi:hypothetical protein
MSCWHRLLQLYSHKTLGEERLITAVLKFASRFPHDGGASKSLHPETLLLIRIFLVETKPSSPAADRFRTHSSLAIIQTAHQALNNLPPVRHHSFPFKLSWEVRQATQSSLANLWSVIWGCGACQQTRDQRGCVLEEC